MLKGCDRMVACRYGKGMLLASVEALQQRNPASPVCQHTNLGKQHPVTSPVQRRLLGTRIKVVVSNQPSKRQKYVQMIRMIK